MTIKELQTLAHKVVKADPRPPNMIQWQRTHPDKWIGARFYYRLMFILAELLKPPVMVELGTDKGYGAWHFAAGNPDGRVIAVDLTLERLEIEPDGVTFVTANTLDVANGVEGLSFGDPIGLILFDSTHTKEHAEKEFSLYDRLCAPNAVQLFDDVMESRSMQEFWSSLPEPKILLEELHPRWGHLMPGFGARIKPDE